MAVATTTGGKGRRKPQENWMIHYTKPGRYRDNGIVYHISDYAKATGKQCLTILDVGCSKAVADKVMKADLEKLGLQPYLFGVDVDKGMEGMAKQNLDLFMGSDIRDLRIYDLPLSDVVICSNVAVWVDGQASYEIVKRCAEQLKDDGVLVTNAFKFPRFPLLERKSCPRLLCESAHSLENGLRPFLSEYQRRKKEDCKLMSKAIYGRSEAMAYARTVWDSWNVLSEDSKTKWKSTIKKRQSWIHRHLN